MEKTIQEIQAQISRQLQLTSETASLDAQVLIAHYLEKPRSWVLAHPDNLVERQKYRAIASASSRLFHGEPLPYVIGHWEFYGLDFLLTPDVLIPRPETELLVDRAISWLQENPHRRRVIDIGTGSGCIGISIATKIPDVHMLLTDTSAKALNIARQNIEKHDLVDRIEVCKSDLLNKIPGLFAFDLICANLPYIPSQILDDLPVAKREPRIALDGGMHGLKLIKRMLKQAKFQVDSGGLILLEIDPAQSNQVVQLAHKNFSSARVNILQDLSGKERLIEIETFLTIFHLCQRQDWMSSLQRGKFTDESLFVEGFIHCSNNSQIIDVANRYYQGVPDMIVLAINPEKITSEIRWEKSGEQYYPHIYGPIDLAAVCWVRSIWPESDGIYRHIYGEIN